MIKTLENNIFYINDGENVDINDVNIWNIDNLCNKYLQKYTIGFVGVVVKQDKILMSFPKNFNTNNYNNLIESMQKIITIISNDHKNKNYGIDITVEKDEFPIKDYLDILAYYKQNGLYKKSIKILSKDYVGTIDWIRTINKSDKIIQKSGIVYTPFIVTKRQKKYVFLSYCMDYILNDATKYNKFINLIENYIPQFNNKQINNNMLISQILYIKGSFFKDSEKKLINNMMNYLKWKSEYENNWSFLTTNFNMFWEYLVNNYLNHCAINVDDSSLIRNVNKQFDFKKSNLEYVEDDEIIKQEHNHYKIQYDHLFIDDEQKIIYLFDSKYYSKIDCLNYKQVFYHYHLLSKYKDYKIINGLILPSCNDTYTRVHIDRNNIDNVKIMEYYLSYSDVINSYFYDKK